MVFPVLFAILDEILFPSPYHQMITARYSSSRAYYTEATDVTVCHIDVE